MSDALEPLLAKLGRAKEHNDRFHVELRDFAQSRPYAIRKQIDPETGDQVWYAVGEPEAPPIAIALTIGDVLFNLRATLDHVAWQLVLGNGETPDSRTAFPIYESRSLYDRRAPMKIRGIAPAPLALIEHLQPYARAGAMSHVPSRLALLERLHNVDKHRYLPLITMGNAGGGFVPATAVFDSEHGRIHTGVVHEGTELARVFAPNVDVDFLASADIAFGEDPEIPEVLIGPNNSVSLELFVFLDAVGQVVRMFAPFLPS